jgi:hypothetical protein
VADFGLAKIDDFAASDDRLDLFHLALSIDKTMSVPVTPEERDRYTVMQLIADTARKLGYDGIRYRSSVSPGVNLCIFHSGAFEFLRDGARVIRVKSLHYDFSHEEHVLEPGRYHQNTSLATVTHHP